MAKRVQKKRPSKNSAQKQARYMALALAVVAVAFYLAAFLWHAK